MVEVTNGKWVLVIFALLALFSLPACSTAPTATIPPTRMARTLELIEFYSPM